MHGLKRIWEFLDLNTEGVNPKRVTGTKHMAFLLDPDAGETDGLMLTRVAENWEDDDLFPWLGF